MKARLRRIVETVFRLYGLEGVKALRSIANGKAYGRKTISPEDQAKMQAGRKK